jgi:hypothetical protein
LPGLDFWAGKIFWLGKLRIWSDFLLVSSVPGDFFQGKDFGSPVLCCPDDDSVIFAPGLNFLSDEFLLGSYF